MTIPEVPDPVSKSEVSQKVPTALADQRVDLLWLAHLASRGPEPRPPSRFLGDLGTTGLTVLVLGAVISLHMNVGGLQAAVTAHTETVGKLEVRIAKLEAAVQMLAVEQARLVERVSAGFERADQRADDRYTELKALLLERRR